MAARLRDDLVATAADEQGIACVEVTDPATGRAFRFYDFEYELAQQLTGQPMEAVVAWASATYGLELSSDALDQFIEKLAGLGFLAAQREVQPVPSESGADDDGFLFGPGDAPPGPEDPLALLPQLEILSEPLPPVVPLEAETKPGTVEPVSLGGLDLGRVGSLLARNSDGAAPLPATGAMGGRAGILPQGSSSQLGPGVLRAPPRSVPPAPASSTPSKQEAASAGETPLASIAREIAAATAPPPLGALDAGSAGLAATPSSPSSSFSSSAVAMAGSASSASSAGRGPAAEPGAPTHGTGDATAAPASASASAGATSLSEQLASLRRSAEEDHRLNLSRRLTTPRPEIVVMPVAAEPSRRTLAARARRSPTQRPDDGRRRWSFLPVVVLVGGLVIGAWYLLRPVDNAGPAPAATSSSEGAPAVHVLSPQPTTFYRWFEAVGAVTSGEDEMLAFRGSGRLQDAMPPGTTFSAGETIARLHGATERELAANHLRSRVAFFEQLRDSSRAEGSATMVRQAEIKLEARRQELAIAQAALGTLEIRPNVAGEIAELLVAKGAVVQSGTPVVRVRSAGPRATFALPTEDAARARGLPFCRLETIPGSGGKGDAGTTETKARAIDCVLSPAPLTATAREARLSVDLAGPDAVAPGTQVRLASARYDGVFPVPAAAIVHEGGDIDHVWIVSGGGRFAERRTVEVLATVDALGLIAHGIAIGDAVVVDPPATLKAGAEINVVR